MSTPATFRSLYVAMLRSYLDIAGQASVLYLRKDIQLLERVQSLALGCVEGFRRLSYPTCLIEFEFPPMQRHMLRTTLIGV